MASEAADPPSPQSEIITISGPNGVARINAYTDLALTKRNVVSVAAPSDQPAPKSPGNSQGDIRPVYANDQESNIESTEASIANAGVLPPPHSPNKWARGTVNGQRVSRDPYANGGMVGQEFYNNG